MPFPWVEAWAKMRLITMGERSVPETVPEDDDDVVVALETARVSEERGDLEAAQKWLHRAAAAARRQGRPERAGTLSRGAAQVLGGGPFEPKVEEQQVLSEITEDDFAEQTIVETAEQIASKGEGEPKEAAEGIRSLESGGEIGSAPVLESPTPVVPLANQPKAAAHQALRVGVKKLLGGRFEARPLAAEEEPANGEQEALLVPVGSTKF